ncbi:MAG TPA: Clp protease N-terminal domain-containing protein [Longimicrobiales bacterium]
MSRLRPLTSSTRVALAIARGTAAARGDRDLTPTHVAIGIFREGSNAGLGALWYAGMTEKEIRHFAFELEFSLGEPPGHIPPRLVAIELTAGEEEVLRLSDIEADHFDDPYLGTEHILLAILRAGGHAAQKITERGITLEKYYDGMLSMRRGDPPPNEPSTT